MVQQLSAALATIAAAPPSPVLEVSYAQKPASVAVAAAKASDLRSSLRLVNGTVPWALGTITVAFLLLAVVAGVTSGSTVRPLRRHAGDRTDDSDVIDLRAGSEDAGRPPRTKVHR